MKKEYIKPEMLIEVLESEALMLTMSDNGGIEESLSTGRNERRGRWGNLWDSED